MHRILFIDDQQNTYDRKKSHTIAQQRRPRQSRRTPVYINRNVWIKYSIQFALYLYVVVDKNNQYPYDFSRSL